LIIDILCEDLDSGDRGPEHTGPESGELEG
jgi:hypothetical protein